MKIGMRNIKTAISVFICVIISKLLNLDPPFYAMIAAIISMQNSVTSSLKVGKNRVLGTFVGAVVGLICSLIMPESAVLSFIGIVIIIHTCNTLKWKESVSIGGVVFCAIMVNMKGANPFIYSTNRILDTCIGIGVALLVNYFIYPPQKFNVMYKDYIEFKDGILESFKLKVLNNKNYDIKKLITSVNKVEKEVIMYKDEFSLKRKDHVEIHKFINDINILKEVLLHMEILNSFKNEFMLDDVNKCNFMKIYSDEIEFNKNNDNEYIIYNYHINEILIRLLKISKLNKVSKVIEKDDNEVREMVASALIFSTEGNELKE